MRTTTGDTHHITGAIGRDAMSMLQESNARRARMRTSAGIKSVTAWVAALVLAIGGGVAWNMRSGEEEKNERFEEALTDQGITADMCNKCEGTASIGNDKVGANADYGDIRARKNQILKTLGKDPASADLSCTARGKSMKTVLILKKRISNGKWQRYREIPLCPPKTPTENR